MALRFWLAIPVLVALACGPASAPATAPSATSDQPRSGGTLKVIHREDPPSLSILEEATNSTQFPVMHGYNNLVQFDPTKAPETLETIVPDLATNGPWPPTARASPSS